MDKERSAYAHQTYGLWLDDVANDEEAVRNHEPAVRNHKKALEQAQKVLALHKDHAGGLFLAGKSELAMGHFPMAEKYARRAVEAAPQNPDMYTLLADVLLRSNNQDKAIEVLKNGVEVLQQEGAKATLLWRLTNEYLDTAGNANPERVAAAVDGVKRLRAWHFQPDNLAFLDARVLYANDDWKAALEGFEKVRPNLSDPQLLKCLDYWAGDCYLQQGNPDQAMAAFRRSLGFDKFYFPSHDRIAQIFLANGHPKDAADEYRQAVAGNPTDPVARLAYARTLVRWNLGRSPAEQNWDIVKNELNLIEVISPGNGNVALLYSDMDTAQGHPEEAEKRLKALREAAPTDPGLWVAQANQALRQEKVDQAKTILDEAKAKLGDKVPIRLARARILLRELGLEAGAEIEKLAADADAFSPREKIDLWSGLMNSLQDIKEYDRAKQLGRQVAQLQPHDAQIRYRLLELMRMTFDARNPAASLAELDRVLEEIDAIAGRGPLWLFGKAVRLTLEASHGKPELLDAAMDYARQAQKTAAVLVAASPPPGRHLPTKRQRRGGPAALFGCLDQRRPRFGLHPPPLANALTIGSATRKPSR